MGNVFEVVIPDGPLHPADAVWAIGAGLLVAAAARGRLVRWTVLVLLAVVATVGLRLGNGFVEGYANRPDTGLVIAMTLLIGVGATWHPTRMAMTAPAAISACIAVWAVVPDTEVPLIAGAVLLGAGLRLPKDRPSRLSGAIVVVPVAAAVVGSMGRPGRFWPALLLGGVAIGVTLAVLEVVRRWREGVQRAGTPTTVSPAPTSSTTTAPAPTTAS